MRIKPITIMLCGLFAALTAVFSQVSIPIPGIPINLATLSVLCAGLILGSKLGTVSQLVFLLAGFAGAPVYSMMRSGAAVLTGATGGYIFGYVIAAFVAGFIAEKFGFKPLVIALALVAGYFSYTIPGTVWYMIVMKTSFPVAVSTCVPVYIPGDIAKMYIAWLIVPRVRKALKYS